MYPKALEEELNAFKEVDERIMARPDILCRLQNINISIKRADKMNTDERTERRTPIPVKTAFAEGSAYTPMLQCTSGHHDLFS